MNKPLQVLTLIAAVGFSGAANAALVNRGGGLIYDDDLNITWLANANVTGMNIWNGAMDWASNFSYYDSVRNVTYTDWRLPTSDNNNCSGFHCTGSEMGHLFYNELGGAAGAPIYAIHNANYYLFTNLQPSRYWSGTPVASNAWTFNFYDGTQSQFSQSNGFYALAVRTGDVVPVPAAVWLFGSGLIGLLGVARRRKVPAQAGA